MTVTPEFAPQAGATEVDPTQKPGGLPVTRVGGAGAGLSTVLPVCEVEKSYVLPTIVALALAANTRDKAAAVNEAPILMSFPLSSSSLARPGSPALCRWSGLVD